MTVSEDVPGSHDFDFLFGTWSIHNRRFTSRLTGSRLGTIRARQTFQPMPMPGGIDNVDEFRTNWPGHEGFIGGSYRFSRLATRTWCIYWADNVTGVLRPPVSGGFQDGVGTFFGKDDHEGTPVLARFTWADVATRVPRREQALSIDNGQTWETNGTMECTRTRIEDQSGFHKECVPYISGRTDAAAR